MKLIFDSQRATRYVWRTISGYVGVDRAHELALTQLLADYRKMHRRAQQAESEAIRMRRHLESEVSYWRELAERRAVRGDHWYETSIELQGELQSRGVIRRLLSRLW